MEKCKCKRCGWEGEPRELGSKTVYEDYGDVCCSVCPSCGAVEYDGFELFEFSSNGEVD